MRISPVVNEAAVHAHELVEEGWVGEVTLALPFDPFQCLLPPKGNERVKY